MKNGIKFIVKALLFLCTLLILIVIVKFSFIGKNIDVEKCKTYLLPSAKKNNVRLTFLGTSCFIINYEGKQFISDAFFSNPSLISTALGNMKQQSIKSYLNDSLYKHVSMTTISHGHYDHCFDLNQILQPQTTVIADQSTIFQLEQELKNNTSKIALKNTEKQNWIYSADSIFRVFPILCKHNPHFGKTILFNGIYKQALDKIPNYLWQWKLGHSNYSFLIDVLKNDSTIFRMALLSGTIDDVDYKKIDSICSVRTCDILSSTFWNKKLNAQSLKKSLSSTKAHILLLNHWNNFFRSNDKSIQQFRTSKLEKELKEFKEEGIPAYIMLPFTSVDL
ncbi:MAG TPA: MBL fold metallo-hydrolase [Chitinophagales bacterium]|jgi:hypothetical protein|nr:MBL fold metallo-hydrolase [Chitinophagales bacterium]MBP6154501.1 MBL fold metallo-hydrolase [Chitinophagales bacterium]HQV78718.1 MBL fold metallo-hydrolase [Chitinophagales bacterium]HQW79084.1 MBL fold metallo-hydrolase [Chitinophagales bacterium]HRB18693.1 MBL fold metallo-hydrolase [Chitinophagales bacterium]